MHKKLPLLAASAIAGLALVISSLNAADAPAPAASSASASGSAAATPAAASASASASASAAASGSASAPRMGRTPPKPDLTKLPKASDKKDLTFDKDIAPMLKDSCANCHGATNPKQGFSILTKESILKGGKAGKEIVPGKSEESIALLYAADAVARNEMPPLRNRTAAIPVPALTQAQLADFRAWIDQGAK